MIKNFVPALCCAALPFFSASVIADDDGRTNFREPETSRCYPGDAVVISKTGVKSMVPSRCFRGSVSVSVSGQTNPWDQSINPTMIYSRPGDAFSPVVVNLADYRIRPGEYIALACIGGTTNAGGLPRTGCDGLKGFGFPPTDNIFQPACSTYYPSFYVDSSNYPIYVFQVIGVFTNASGIIVGKPFSITSATENVAVPKHAATLQLGINDCLNADNAPDPLTIMLSY